MQKYNNRRKPAPSAQLRLNEFPFDLMGFGEKFWYFQFNGNPSGTAYRICGRDKMDGYPFAWVVPAHARLSDEKALRIPVFYHNSPTVFTYSQPLTESWK